MRIFERVTLTDPTQTFAIEVIVEEFETESLAISYIDVSIQSYLKPVSLSDQCPGDPELSDIGQITTPLVGDESIAIRVTMTYPPSLEHVQEISVIRSTIMSRDGRFLSTVQGYALASDPIDDVANVATQILADDWIHASERLNQRDEMGRASLWARLPSLSEIPPGFAILDEADVTDLVYADLVCPTPTASTQA